MRLSSLHKYFGFLLIVLLSACLEQENPVTKEEAAQLGRSIEGSMKRQSPAKFNQALDVETLVEHMKKNSKVKINNAMVRGLADGLKSGRLGTEVLNSIGEGGSYGLVKQYEKDKKQHLVFRLFGGDGQVNYHDMELVKKKEQVKIADIFIYLSGEDLSTTLGQTMVMLDDNFDSMNKEDREQVNNIKKIRKLLNEGKNTEADRLYQQLPEVLKQQRMFQIVRIEIASKLGDEVYLKAMDDYERTYPDVPNLFLMKIDAYFLRKDFKEAMNAVNKLDSLIDKDPFLDYYRSLISKKMEDKQGQYVYLERLAANMPEFAPGMVELVVYHMDNNDTEKAVLVAQKLKAGNKANKEQLEALYELYPDLQKKLE